MDESEGGVRLGQRLVPLERIGIYVPGGLAAYPSTVLMAAIPARIAGVGDIVIVSPLRDRTVHPLVAAAAHLSGVSRVFKIGGAQAIAALAYGTASIPRVDKIVGPGNAYVAAAKKLVYGQVAIDMIAGPSEILVIADGKTPASFIAADLLAQAEHDEMASAVLLTPDEAYARAVSAEVSRQVETLKRKAIAVRSLDRYGVAIVTKDMNEAVTLANRFAPEHLELAVSDPDELLPLIRHAGAIFMGSYTPETLGDYLAGPNHILPTSGTARFSSALGVYDFVKRISVLSFSPASFRQYGPDAARFADLEGLEGHGNAIRVRL
jgi:histidinol dehydrogenase